MLVSTYRNVGDFRTPQDIKRMRRANIEMARRMGQPCVWKHRFNLDDLQLGSFEFQLTDTIQHIAVQRCPACFDESLEGSRADCEVCFGTTLCSVETEVGLYVTPATTMRPGRLTTTTTSIPAPLHRGFGPAVLVWTIQPDVPEDQFRLDQRGALMRVQTPTVTSPWLPKMADNDLLANVRLADDQRTVREVQDRFELKKAMPSTIRGFGKVARGRDFLVAQTFEMTRLPNTHPYQNVKLPSTNTDQAAVTFTVGISGIEVFT